MVKGKELSTEQIEQIYIDLANGMNQYKVRDKYSIGYDRLLNIINKGGDRINEYRQKIALKCEKEFIPKTIVKRSQMLDAIDDIKINKASLTQLTQGIDTMTDVKRLESGQSTENVSIVSKELNDEQLREFIINGNIGVTNEK